MAQAGKKKSEINQTQAKKVMIGGNLNQNSGDLLP